MEENGVKKVGILVKPARAGEVPVGRDVLKLGTSIAAWVAGKGGKVFAEESAASGITPSEPCPAQRLKDAVEVLVVLGGDGTMLHAARLLEGEKIPILGVNMGGLGFLTAITVSEVFGLLERVFRDECTVEERMMLSVSVERDGKKAVAYKVLNDAVIKAASARLLRMETRINREYVTTYRADGLIIASPTGSTAYSLSANGPILYPTIHSIIVSPICPFNLTNRPVVIPDWMTVDVTIAPGHPETSLILDGQKDVQITAGDVVTVKRAEESVYLVMYEGKSYFDILRERLMWEVKKDPLTRL